MNQSDNHLVNMYADCESWCMRARKQHNPYLLRRLASVQACLQLSCLLFGHRKSGTLRFSQHASRAKDKIRGAKRRMGVQV
ncbi:hypothetical protein CVT26_013235 [Gymnopilus dilepis]|uniref:Uncharacterized protein n=1 Tax=Gymnopilus dilepis TaxID=231916 RepID=A0A409WV52_9AGAR|nr:hypothetical protein CVT26_013235 [Gymnopilus dilepis]